MSKMSLYTLLVKLERKYQFYIKSYAWKYIWISLDDETTHVDPCPHNGHSVGWTVMKETIAIVCQILGMVLENKVR